MNRRVVLCALGSVFAASVMPLTASAVVVPAWVPESARKAWIQWNPDKASSEMARQFFRLPHSRKLAILASLEENTLR